MRFIKKLERKLGRFAIPNLTVYIIGAYIIGYLLSIAAPSVLQNLGLNVSMILRGQIWRLVTWIFYPPSSGSLLLFVLMIFFFYYPLGTSLERTIGTFWYNFYIWGGIILTVIGAFIVHFIWGGRYDLYAGFFYSTYYIALSIFLAYAALYPEHQILLWFVIPLKMKWMAWVDIAIMLYDIYRYLRAGYSFMIVPIVAALLNFLIFFLMMRNDLQRFSPKEIKRKREFRKAMRPQSEATGHSGGPVTKHKCAICGRTELDDPDLEFRFCSRCKGNYEYCQDHLFTHTHIQ